MIVSNGQVFLEIRESDGRFTAKFGGETWRESGLAYIEIAGAGRTERIRLVNANKTSVIPFQNGVGHGARIVCEGFDGHPGLKAEMAVWLEENTPRLRLDVVNCDPGEGRFVAMQWPAPMEYAGAAKDSYALVPMMQGLLIPRDHPEPVDIVMPPPSSPVVFYERAAYMGWLAQVNQRRGCLLVPDNADDCGYMLAHHPGEGTELGLIWQASMGRFAYQRGAVFHFLADCDYSDICKVYRQYAKEKGYLVTLNEKIARTPSVRQLIGSPVIHTGIMMQWDHSAETYKEGMEDTLNTFRERGEQILRLKELGMGKAYLHLDGWGKAGYDNQHPDIWPPCEAAGGVDGMRALGRLLRENDVLFAIHDQYRDYYVSAASFDAANTRKLMNGEAEYECAWVGGRQSHLCNLLAPDYVRRNFARLKNADIGLDGAYLDVFAVIALEECYDPAHPMTRAQCRQARIRCFDYVRAQGMLVSSEEPVEWSVPHMDMVHHAPFATLKLGEINDCRAVPVPLFELVYHDCIVAPWTATVGGWGIPKGYDGGLFAMLFGDTAYLDIAADAGEIRRIEQICANHERLATVEILKHEFLDQSLRKQRTIFADGTRITVDMDARTCSVE